MLKHHTAHNAVTIKRGQGRTGVEASYHTNCPNDRERTLTGKNLHWGITSHTAVMIQWITCIEVSHHTHCCDNTVKQGRTSIEVSYHMHCCDITVKTGKNSQSGIISHTLLYWGIISHTHTTVKAQWRQWRTHTEASYDTHWSTEASCHTHTALLWQYAEDREELTLTLYCTWHSQMIRRTRPKNNTTMTWLRHQQPNTQPAPALVTLPQLCPMPERNDKETDHRHIREMTGGSYWRQHLIRQHGYPLTATDWTLPFAPLEVDDEKDDTQHDAQAAHHQVGNAQKGVLAPQPWCCRQDDALCPFKCCHRVPCHKKAVSVVKQVQGRLC